jgi:hypothetical protein
MKILFCAMQDIIIASHIYLLSTIGILPRPTQDKRKSGYEIQVRKLATNITNLLSRYASNIPCQGGIEVQAVDKPKVKRAVARQHAIPMSGEMSNNRSRAQFLPSSLPLE